MDRKDNRFLIGATFFALFLGVLVSTNANKTAHTRSATANTITLASLENNADLSSLTLQLREALQNYNEAEDKTVEMQEEIRSLAQARKIIFLRQLKASPHSVFQSLIPQEMREEIPFFLEKEHLIEQDITIEGILTSNEQSNGIIFLTTDPSVPQRTFNAYTLRNSDEIALEQPVTLTAVILDNYLFLP